MSRQFKANTKKPFDVALRLFLIFSTGFAFTLTAATVTGPITGGEQGAPFSASDVGEHGYVNEEYFVDGEAAAYELVDGEHTADGKWNTQRSDNTAQFRTRILVVRPMDADAFNGTVILFWQNVTAGYELGSAGGESLRGYAWVGVSAQKIGIDGFPQNPQGLKAWDSTRYGSLVHPGDAYSYDIFTHAARAVGADRKSQHSEDEMSTDPMGGLKVERVIAAGASQSAARLRTYINGVHPVERVIDGYIPFIDFGRGVPFARDLGAGRGGGGMSIRNDLEVPVIVVNSETELTSYFSVREPDSDMFRLWEVAGTSHVSVPRPADRGEGASNWLSYDPVYNAAIRHLHLWLKDGIEPPKMPRVEMKGGTAPPEVVRDQHGNAVGGIRLPDMEVPTASHSGFGTRRPGVRFSFLFGTATDFDNEQLAALYPDSKHYLDAWNKALDRAVSQGMVLAEDAPAMRAQAAAWAQRLDEQESGVEDDL